MTSLPLPARPFFRAFGTCLLAILATTQPPSASAQALNALGTTGGLAIPDASSLGDGGLAVGFGNAREPQLGPRDRPRSFVLGVGLAPGVDLVGRFAEYATRAPGRFWTGGNPTDGVSDLSVNAKFSFAPGDLLPGGMPGLRVAAGVQDAAGAGARFRTAYLVATQTVGRFAWTGGLGRSRAEIYVPGTEAALDGPFGGVAWQLPTGESAGTWTMAAEHDGRQPLAGLRWTSPPLALLGRGTLNASVHRTAERGAALPGATAWSIGLMLPLGDEERRIAAAEPAPPRPAPVPRAADATPAARLGALKQALVDAGLERVRVGRRGDGGWVVEYQNRRFGHNEVDALGLVAGLAARLAPAEVAGMTVVALKQGQPVLTLDSAPGAWRAFLNDGNAAALRDVTQVQRGDGAARTGVDWISDQPGPATWLQLQFTPEISYTLGTEVGAVDHSLALRLLASVPLWQGAQVFAITQKIVDASRNAGPTGVFADLRQPEGLQALALQQTWWVGPWAVLSGAVGRFENDARGAEGQALVFVPGRDDVVRLRARRFEVQPDQPPGTDFAQSLSYRWVASPSTWLELGAQRYNDASSGPSVVASRWWGDVGVHLFYRRGGERRFAGVEFSFPLTPRAGPATPGVQVGGIPSYRRGLRTRLTDANTAFNYVEPRRVRDLQLSWDVEVQSLNAGRLGRDYLLAQLPRMRQAYELFAPAP